MNPETHRQIGHFSGEPVYKPLTPEEKLLRAGIDPEVARLGMAVLGQRPKTLISELNIKL